ncbi:hypothetical protein BCR35DRAFT_311274 [Leucosporidium creatinivorum]|uniref:Uncharacterized protein n=1 Tax=Leucosporidium creatinivorum TaxID=106004 RepID=A0A1Y2C5X9_9BASI|nr:hypothetical protein BCR35DRAFT_311274 [Leucosporidium creatinivorum]
MSAKCSSPPSLATFSSLSTLKLHPRKALAHAALVDYYDKERSNDIILECRTPVASFSLWNSSRCARAVVDRRERRRHSIGFA